MVATVPRIGGAILSLCWGASPLFAEVTFRRVGGRRPAAPSDRQDVVRRISLKVT